VTDLSLTESTFARAKRDTWPEGWLRKWIHRVVAIAIALSAAYLLGSSEVRAEFFTRVETAIIGLLAVLGADLLFYPWNLTLAPYRQRVELRSLFRAAEVAQSDFAELSASAERVSGEMRRIEVRNEGARSVSAIRIQLGESNWVLGDGWKNGDEVIPILKPGEEDSIPFYVRRSMGRRSERVRARISGTCSLGHHVEAELLLDPHSLI
jgi:hypothetical protein